MQTIEARAILSASDKTGGVFGQIAAKIKAMTTTAATANRTAAVTANSTAMQARAAAATAYTANKAAQAANKSGNAAAAGNAAVLAGAGRVLAPAAAAGMAAKAYKNFADSDLAVRRIGITADASEEQVSKLSHGLRDLAQQTGLSFGKVTKGLESLTAGGMDLPEAIPALPAIAKTAQAAGAEVEDMATTTLALNQNLKIATNEMQTAFDILVKGGKEGKFELKDMARYFPSIAPAAVAAGMKGEEGLMRIVAALQTIRQGTGTTEEAAASMQNIFAKMESETTTKKFKEMGVDLKKEMDAARKSGKDLLEVFVGLTEQATKGDLSKIPQLFTDMEFARGMRALLSYKDLNKKVLDSVRAAAGSTQKDFEKIINTPSIAMDRMKEATDRMINSLGYGIDQLSKKLGGGNKSGLTAGLNDAANKIEEIANTGLGPAVDKLFSEQENANREREIINLEDSVRGRQALIERAKAQGREMSPRRIEELTKDAIRLFELQQLPTVGTAIPGGKLFTDEEIQKFREMPLQKSEVTLPRSDPRKAKTYAPEPMADPRKKNYGSDMPSVQPLEDLIKKDTGGEYGRGGNRDVVAAIKELDSGLRGKEADKSGTAAILDAINASEKDNMAAMAGAVKGLDVKAELTGSAEVKGETEVKVVVEAGSELLRIVDSVKQAVANLAGRLSANGPGSNGRSSPDAVPGSISTGKM